MTEPDNIQGDNISKESPSQSAQHVAAQQAGDQHVAARHVATPCRPGENSDLVFYYSSARRERRASLLEQNTNSRRGFVKSLIGSRGNFFLLISILGIFLIFILGNRASLNREQGGFILEQNTVALSAIEEEEILYLFVHKKSPSWRTAYTGPVDISVAPVLSMGEGEPVFVTQRVFFSNKSPEAFRLALPFESDGLMVILKTENETIMRTIKKGP
jgi:hypothetical protein